MAKVQKEKNKNKKLGIDGLSIRNRRISARLSGRRSREYQISIGNGYKYLQDKASGIEEGFVASRLSDNKKVMVKGDFREPFLGLVTIAPYRARMTNRMQKLPKLLQRPASWIFSLVRLRPAMEQSKNLLMECLANDIAKQSGMVCQEQSVEISTYLNGDLKILAVGEWQDGLESLGKVQGGNYAEGNYLVSDDHVGDLAVADDSIKSMGEEWALMVMMGDIDGLGSRLQNKKVLNHRLFGLDFGQAFRGENTAVTHLSDNGLFAGKGNPYKNYSIFDDCPLSEKMAGVHYMRKLFFGIEPNDRVKDSFGKEFKERLAKIEPGEGMEIFDQYTEKFNELRKEAKTPKQWAQLKSFAREIKKAKNIAETSANNLNRAFGARVGYTKEELDIVENLEKLTSKTSLRSGDGSVFLNHIKIDKRVAWDRVKGPNNTIQFKPRSRDDSYTVEKYLEKITGLNDNFRTTPGDAVNGALIKCSVENVKNLLETVSEDRIKQAKHEDDFKVYNNIKDNPKLLDKIQVEKKTRPNPLKKLFSEAKNKASERAEKSQERKAAPTGAKKGKRPSNTLVLTKHLESKIKEKSEKIKSLIQEGGKFKGRSKTSAEPETKKEKEAINTAPRGFNRGRSR